MSYKLTTGWPQHVETGAFVNPETNAEYVAWIAAGNTPLPYVAPEQTPEQIREAKKAHRAEAVASIVVTTSTGKSFDGDELSQGRMSRAILVMQALSAPVTTWVLSDNTPTEVTLAEITEALALAGQEQSRLWVLA